MMAKNKYKEPISELERGKKEWEFIKSQMEILLKKGDGDDKYILRLKKSIDHFKDTIKTFNDAINVLNQY